MLLTDFVRINNAMAKIGPNATRVLADIAERLAKGAAEHGDFEVERDWLTEAYEEDLDNIVYRTMHLAWNKDK